MQHSQHKAVSRAAQGAAAVPVLFTIAGVVSIILGVLSSIAAIVYAVEDVYDASDMFVVAVFAVIALSLFLGGAAMIYFPSRYYALKAQHGSAFFSPQQGSAYDQAERARAAAPAVAPAPAQQPAAPPAPGAAPAPASAQPASRPQNAYAEETARLLNRSEDIFATCKDLIRTQAAHPSSQPELTHLTSMLNATGLLSWPNPPTCDATRLSRTSQFWLRHDASELPAEQYDLFTACEAAINVDLAMPAQARTPYDDPACSAAALHYLRDLANQQVTPYDFSDTLDVTYPGIAHENTPGEWFIRTNAVHIAECVRLPFRLAYDLRVNAELGAAMYNLTIPRPAAFAIFTPSAAGQVAYARAYALRVSYLLARLLLKACPALEHVDVAAHEQGNGSPVLAISFTRELVASLAPVVNGTGIDSTGFPSSPDIVVGFQPNGWFGTISAPFALDSETFSPRKRFVYPELSDAPLSPALAQISGGRVLADLSINENAARIEAADQLERTWRTLDLRSTEAVVRTLTDLRESANHHTVLEACARTITALNEGEVDPADDRALRHIFVSGGALERAAARANQLLDDEEHADPEAVVSLLTEVLDPIRALGEYADDEFTVYRYFGSVSERLVFNLRVDDHTREVKLVPDAYFDALASLASAYIALGQNEQAIEVADELMRIAPVSVYAALRKVRALEHESRIFEAADLIKQKLAYAATPRDAALAHYRLAYMEWKLGREDLGVACYQRSLTWNTQMSPQAREELQDLLESYPHLHRLSDAEVERALAAEGIPMGFDKADVERTVKTAVLLTDEGFFWTSKPLVSVLCNIEGDDVLIGIHKSLDAPEM